MTKSIQCNKRKRSTVFIDIYSNFWGKYSIGVKTDLLTKTRLNEQIVYICFIYMAYYSVCHKIELPLFQYLFCRYIGYI